MKNFSRTLLIAAAAVFPLGVAAQMIPEHTEQRGPKPKVVTPGNYDNMVTSSPSDAIVLFDGKNLDSWISQKTGGDAPWVVKDGVFYVKPESGDIVSKQSFGDCQIHLEWMIPEGTEGHDQGRGNSGIYIQQRYEVQILDSYQSETYVNGQAGSIYKQYPPLVNAMQKQGNWNVYDIVFTAPRFKEDGSLHSPAVMTVLHNGILVQNHAALQGPTLFIGIPRYTDPHGKAPIMLQDHNCPVHFRNIWVREL